LNPFFNFVWNNLYSSYFYSMRFSWRNFILFNII